MYVEGNYFMVRESNVLVRRFYGYAKLSVVVIPCVDVIQRLFFSETKTYTLLILTIFILIWLLILLKNKVRPSLSPIQSVGTFLLAVIVFCCLYL